MTTQQHLGYLRRYLKDLHQFQLRYVRNTPHEATAKGNYAAALKALDQLEQEQPAAPEQPALVALPMQQAGR